MAKSVYTSLTAILFLFALFWWIGVESEGVEVGDGESDITTRRQRDYQISKSDGNKVLSNHIT